MKKALAILFCLVLVAMSAMPSLALGRRHYRHSYAYSTSSRRTYYVYGDRRSFWQKHRDKLTTAIGTGGGALVGGAVGGGRGAAVGALAGGGGSALWTYKMRKGHRY